MWRLSLHNYYYYYCYYYYYYYHCYDYDYDYDYDDDDDDYYSYSYYYYIIIVCLFVSPLIALGSPELSSSTSTLELSGEVCPGYITLICSKNTTERIFVWYTNDNELARFDEEDVTPFTIKTRLDLFNATIRVTSVVEVNGYFSFDNFTLTARVSDFLPIQGQNLTCGTRLNKSEPFRVDNFTVSRRGMPLINLLSYEISPSFLDIHSW